MLAARRNTDWSHLLKAYRPSPDGHDELIDRSGAMRPHWAPVLGELAGLAPAEIAQRFAAADRHLKNSGVYYRVYDSSEGDERPWPLAPVPLIIPRAEWRVIEDGLIQRAKLLEIVLADLHGSARLVSDRALPAAVVAGNPEFLRPQAGVVPRGGEHLVVYAADLGRGPDGRWWVLGDRAQAPSGMGYVLENRLAISGALPQLYRDMHVERLAGFFQSMRTTLAGKAGSEGARIGLLTPGPANETYFEHAYLARYLGFLLVEGGDLAVQDDHLYVRTIEGLKHLDVLLRRLDADFVDPLELGGASRIGVPGLMQAVRAGTLALANGLGAGLVEARAMLAFLPALARRLMGEDLLLPNVATWWCGDDAARMHVLANLDRLAVEPAFYRRVPGLARDRATLATALDARARARLADTIATHALDIVGQETVKLATMPVWTGAGLEPRPFTLRAYAVSTATGWQVMLGGFCRVGESSDPLALSMQHGGRSADVWITGDGPVEPVSLLTSAAKVTIRRRLGHLPSRAADNLFWLGRYLERAEATLRLVRALAELAVEASDDRGESLVRLGGLLVAWGAGEKKDGAIDLDATIEAALTGEDGGGVPSLIARAARAASAIRERLSPDAMLTLADLRALAETDLDEPPADRADRMLRLLAALSGLAQENMNRISGWRFLQMGRRIERGILTCRLARRLADTSADEGSLDALLKLTDSRITYRARYLMGTLRLPVLDLVMLDDGNPRSVAFQIVGLSEHLAALPGAAHEGEVDPPGRAARVLRTTVETSEATDVDDTLILSIENRLLALSNDITARFFGQGEARGEAEGLG